MTLPGKLTICYLEEDVPQKAYFRIKPLFVKGEGAFEHIENAQDALPDEGGIRIVPDKNESSRFKARMRTLGKFCMLDLTKHPNENDKIRPNKNYSPEKLENNRNIVYSDVIDRCPEDWLLEVVRVDEIQKGQARAVLADKPGTPLIALITGGKIYAPFVMSEGEEENECVFTQSENYEPRVFDENAYTRLFKTQTTEDQFVEFIACSNAAPIFQKKEAAAPVVEEEAEAPAPKAEQEKIPEEKPAPENDEPVKQIAENVTKEIEEEKTEQAEEKPAAEEKTVPVSVGEPLRPAVEEKPIPKVAEAEPAVIKPSARTYQRDAAYSSQTGLNPRRGRSLLEIVDDGWRKSRLEQLGSPVPGDVTGQPVISPIERAADTLKTAWALKEARGALIDEILAIEDMPQALAPRFAVSGGTPATEAQLEQLNDLEAERLRLLGEIDELRRHRLEKRTELMDEARKVHQAEIQKLENDIQRLKSEAEKRLRQAEAARDAQSKAAKLMDKTMRDVMKEEFVKYALHAGIMAQANPAPEIDEADYMHSPKTYEPTAAQLVSDVRRIFEQSGKSLTNDEAVNLIACLALGKIVVVSGETGAGKSSLVREMASALGLKAPGARRFAELNASMDSALDDPAFRALTRYEDMNTLRVVMLDDANLLKTDDQTRGLITWAENRQSSLRVVMTVMDDQIGYPVNPRILDRAFMIRLNKQAPGAWEMEKPLVKNAERSVSLAAFEKMFRQEQHIPGEVVNRLQVLREKLAQMNVSISGRALSDMYAYCAACIPLMTCPPKAVLDYALAQRAIPHILATTRLEIIEKLPELLADMPMCLSLMSQPLPLPPV